VRSAGKYTESIRSGRSRLLQLTVYGMTKCITSSWVRTAVYVLIEGTAHGQLHRPDFLQETDNRCQMNVSWCPTPVDDYCHPTRSIKTHLCNRSFAVDVPRVWNMLPVSLCLVDNYTRFRRLLKTHCLTKAAVRSDKLF